MQHLPRGHRIRRFIAVDDVGAQDDGASQQGDSDVKKNERREPAGQGSESNEDTATSPYTGVSISRRR